MFLQYSFTHTAQSQSTRSSGGYGNTPKYNASANQNRGKFEQSQDLPPRDIESVWSPGRPRRWPLSLELSKGLRRSDAPEKLEIELEIEFPRERSVDLALLRLRKSGVWSRREFRIIDQRNGMEWMMTEAGTAMKPEVNFFTESHKTPLGNIWLQRENWQGPYIWFRFLGEIFSFSSPAVVLQGGFLV